VRRALLLAGCLAAALAACGRDESPTPVRAVAPPSTPAPRPRESSVVESVARADGPTADAAARLPPDQRPYVATRSLAGRVVDPQGRSVAGARVAFGGASTVTAKDGAFRLDGLEAKSAYAEVTAAGFAREQWSTWPGREDLVVTIRRVVRVRGTVVRTDGALVEGAEVEHSVRTGADGRFEVDLHEGRDGIYATWGPLPGCRDDDVAASGTTYLDVDPDHPPHDVRVVLDEAWSWIGARAVRADGAVAKDASIGVHVPGKSWWWYGPSEGAAGWAVPVPPGTEVELGAEIEERGVVTAKGSVRASTLPGAGAYVDVELHAVESPRVATKESAIEPERGSIAIDVSDARVVERGPLQAWIGGPDFRTVTHDVVSATRRSFVTGRVAPGSYVVVMYSSERTYGDERWWIRHIDVTPGATARLVCDAIESPAALRGRVVGPDDKPRGGAAVGVLERPWFRESPYAQTSTDAAGRFEVKLPDADHCWIAAHCDGFAWAFVRVGPHAASDAEIRLTRGGTIEFHIADGDFVASDPNIESPAGDLRFSAKVEWAGKFESILHVPAGRWTVRMDVTHKPRAVTVDVRDGETTVVKLDAE